MVYVLVAKEVNEGMEVKDPKLRELLKEFKDVFPSELPFGLPPKRGIEHQIDLIPGAPIPNKPSRSIKLLMSFLEGRSLHLKETTLLDL